MYAKRRERERDTDNWNNFSFRGTDCSLLRPTHALLKQIATHLPFEAAVGANGAVWVRAASPKHVIAVCKVLEAADVKATSHNSEQTAGEGQEDDNDGQVDAEYVVKHRAGGLDAKAVRLLVQEYL